jgi:hypothetical protein
MRDHVSHTTPVSSSTAKHSGTTRAPFPVLISCAAMPIAPRKMTTAAGTSLSRFISFLTSSA